MWARAFAHFFYEQTRIVVFVCIGKSYSDDICLTVVKLLIIGFAWDSKIASLWLVQHSSTSSAATNGAGASETADDDLPSVMTCANYLKLPPYSTKVRHVAFSILLESIIVWVSLRSLYVIETGNNVQETALRHQRRARIVRPLISNRWLCFLPASLYITLEDWF